MSSSERRAAKRAKSDRAPRLWKASLAQSAGSHWLAQTYLSASRASNFNSPALRRRLLMMDAIGQKDMVFRPSTNTILLERKGKEQKSRKARKEQHIYSFSSTNISCRSQACLSSTSAFSHTTGRPRVAITHSVFVQDRLDGATLETHVLQVYAASRHSVRSFLLRRAEQCWAEDDGEVRGAHLIDGFLCPDPSMSREKRMSIPPGGRTDFPSRLTCQGAPSDTSASRNWHLADRSPARATLRNQITPRYE